MGIEISDREKNYLKSVLYKAQFKQKLGLKYKILTGFSVSMFVIVMILPYDIMISSWIYLAAYFIYSKWFFNLTKDKGYYEPFLIKIYAELKRETLLKIREMRV